MECLFQHNQDNQPSVLHGCADKTPDPPSRTTVHPHISKK